MGNLKCTEGMLPQGDLGSSKLVTLHHIIRFLVVLILGAFEVDEPRIYHTE